MCYGAEAVWVPAVISALGAGASMYSNNQALRKQDQSAAAGIIKQGQLRDQAQGGIKQTIKQIAQSSPTAAKQQQDQAYLGALREAQPVASKTVAGVPGGSARYAEDVGAAQAGVQKYGTDTASAMAATDAPYLQRLKEGQVIGNEATNLGLLNDTSNAQDYLTKLRTAAIQPNPWISAAGQTLSGVGAGLSKRKPGASDPNSSGWSQNASDWTNG